jgi:hypothetical protein
VRLALWQALERPDLMHSLAPVAPTVADKVDAIARAQAAGQVGTALSADRLLDHILTLAHGNVALAGLANDWTDAQRRDLGISVARLTAPDTALRRKNLTSLKA